MQAEVGWLDQGRLRARIRFSSTYRQPGNDFSSLPAFACFARVRGRNGDDNWNLDSIGYPASRASSRSCRASSGLPSFNRHRDLEELTIGYSSC